MAECETCNQSINSKFRFNSVLKALLNGLAEQKRDGRFCDVILKISDRKVAAHSSVLAVFSPWMMSMLSRIRRWPFVSDVPEEIDLNLPGSDELFQALKCIVDYMYTGKMRVDHENVDNLQKVSEVLKVPTVTTKCKSWKLRHGRHQNYKETNAVDNNCTTGHEQQVENRENLNENNMVDEAIVDCEEHQQQKDDVSISRRKSRRKNTPIKKPALAEGDNVSDEHVAAYKDNNAPLSGLRRSSRCKRATKTMKEFTSDGSNEDDDACSGKETPNRLHATRYSCPTSTCTFEASTEEELQEHRKSHLGKLYQCNSCGFSFKTVAKLLCHLAESNHSITACSVCNFEAPDVEELKVHLKRHEDPKPFWCDTRFKTNYELGLHLRTHSSETPFVCEVCSKGFKFKKALQDHVVVHEETKRFVCDECGFGAAHENYLEVHRRMHTGDTYKCPHPGCTHKAIRKQNLKLHMLIHTKDKPHKTLSRHSKLQSSNGKTPKCDGFETSAKDAKTPAKQKTFQCDVCGLAFTTSRSLIRHSRIHNAVENLLKCDKCPFVATTRLDKLKQHIRKHHGNESSTAVVNNRQLVNVENNNVVVDLETGAMPVEVVMAEIEVAPSTTSPAVR